ncbi:hypothetical protein FOL47_008724 [Perkinsus chesapeaki]|uniref:DNA 3'-5' helicase n=1 Tax=Perkinsus chesapeaki TaxID=330153 RepID=A0A7J6LC74_PERCH|nr:hypothetical protein FOL47_008724 [Perkinsus chesapeaki]
MPTFTPSVGWFTSAEPAPREAEAVAPARPVVVGHISPPVSRRSRSRGPISLASRKPLPRQQPRPQEDKQQPAMVEAIPTKELSATRTYSTKASPPKQKIENEARNRAQAAANRSGADNLQVEKDMSAAVERSYNQPSVTVVKKPVKRKRQSGGRGVSGPPKARMRTTKAPRKAVDENDIAAKPAEGTAAAVAAPTPSSEGGRLVSNNFVYQNLKHKGHSKSNKHVEKMKRKIGMDSKGRMKHGGSAKGAILNGGKAALRRRGGQRIGGYTKAQRARLRRIELAQEMLKSRQLADQKLSRGSTEDRMEDLEERGSGEARNTVFSESVDVAKLDIMMEERLKKKEAGEAECGQPVAGSVRTVEAVELPTVPTSEELDKMLREEFGHRDGFRPGQKEAIQALLGGSSCLVILPTGQGKSLIYQIIARIYRKQLGLRGGVTVVVSPLISLMADQLRQLPSCVRGATINSTMTPYEMDAVLLGAAEGEIDLLLVAPERLLMWSFQNALPLVNLVAIDEAHCISEWSHSFRPAYQRITGVIRRQLRPAHLLALTATATSRTISSIVHILGGIDVTVRADGVVEERLDDDTMDQEESSSMVLRKNLRLSGSVTLNPLQSLLELLHTSEYRPLSSIIVYVAYQWQTEQVARLLCQRGVRAGAYHGGMSSIERNEVQEAFIRGAGAAGGGIQVIVATVAFGMGIDKSDVRAVIHMALPRSLENYVQETGRCCRDGFEFGLCHVLICHQDYARLRRAVFSDSLDPLSVGSLLGRVLFGEPQDPTDTDRIEPFGSCTCVDPARGAAPIRFTFVDEKQGARELDCSREQLTFLLGLLETAGQGVRGVFHGFPSKVKLRFFSKDPETIARSDPFMRALMAPEELTSSPSSEGASEKLINICVPCRTGVYTIDTRSALPTLAVTSGYASITPPEFMRRLHDAQRKWHFAVEKQDYCHVVVIGNDASKPEGFDSNVARQLAVSLISQVRKHQDHQLVKVDACYLVLKRIAANDNKVDPLFGHRLIQTYFSLASEGREEEVLLTLADGDRSELRKILGPAAVPHEQIHTNERTVEDWETDGNYGGDFNWVRADLKGLLSGGMVTGVGPSIFDDSEEEPFWMDDALWSPSAAATPTSIARIMQGIPSPTYPTKVWKDNSFWGKHEALPFDVLTSMISATMRGK